MFKGVPEDFFNVTSGQVQPDITGITITIKADSNAALLLHKRGVEKLPDVRMEHGGQKFAEESCRFNDNGSVTVYLAVVKAST